MIPRVGKSASEIPMETQMLLLEAGEESVLNVADEDTPGEAEAVANASKFYVLVLPVLDGAFRTTLQGTPSNDLQLCYESGSSFFKLRTYITSSSIPPFVQFTVFDSFSCLGF